MRCPNCGHVNPNGSVFCLNCGTRLASQPAPAAARETPAAPQGLPGEVRCPACATANAPGMNFCRNCGTTLSPRSQPDSQAHRMPSPADMVTGSRSAATSPTRTCPTCSQQTPGGFAFCQQCGGKLPPEGEPSAAAASAIAATLAAPRAAVIPAPSAAPRAVPAPASGAAPSSPATRAPGQAFSSAQQPNIGTNSQGTRRPTPPPGSYGAPPYGARDPASNPAAALAWATLVAVNRDGSDGVRYPLAEDFVVVGRAGADITFEEDRFLARAHARFERGPRLVPLDTFNGVFRRVAGTAALEHGATLLLGREVLRFERVDEDEQEPAPLVRHGVALFGSPPRRPWGRLLQLLPSGGVRDIRHLVADEVILGREEGELVYRDDQFLSRAHAAFRRRGHAFEVEDLQSSNGTYLRIPRPIELVDGVHLRLGDQLFRFES